MTSLSLASSSNKVGETGQNLTVTFVTKNSVPSGGKIYISFPYWNPTASGTIYSFQSYLGSTTSPSCYGVTNIASGMSCSFDTSSQTLTLNSPFTTTISTGTTISFKVGNFKNPITSQITSGFTVSTGDASSGLIDSSAGALQVTSAGSITTSSVRVDNNTVQELTRYRVEFFIPIPLSQGCIVEIQFPSQIALDSTQLSLVQSLGLPSTQRTISGTVDSDENSYIITNACPTYRDNINTAIVYFDSIANPLYVMTTDTLNIYIYDSNSQMLLTTDNSGPTVTTVSGNLLASIITADNSEVNAVTSLTFSIQPLHSANANSKIVIELPDDLVLTSDACDYTAVNLASSSATCVGDSSTNTVTITNALASDYTYSSTQSIQFKIGNIKLPFDTSSTGAITFEFYTTDANSNYQLVDNAAVSDLFTATAGYLPYGSVSGLSLLAFDITTYTIEFSISNPIDKGGHVIITLPSQLSIATTSSASCSNFEGFQTTPTCVFTSSTIRVNSGFGTSQFDDTTIILSLDVSGIQNPRSLQSTSSFVISTYSSAGFMIDEKDDLMTVQMIDTNPITAASVRPTSKVVGDNTTYTFKITSPTKLESGDILIVTFPPELTLPVRDTLKGCYGESRLSDTQSCRISGPYGVRMVLSFSSSPLSAGREFSFAIRWISNPANTDPTSLFTVEIQDAQEFQINKNNPSLTNFKTTMNDGAKFTTISITQQSRKPFIETAYTFSFKLENTLPVSAQIYIEYPSQLSFDSDSFGYYFTNYGTTPSCSLNTKERTILCTTVTGIAISAGTVYTFTIQGFINSAYAKTTDSFTLETRTSNGNVINFADSGLTVSSDCDYPCYTCSSSTPSKCTSCDKDSAYFLFINSQCLQTCPVGYYSANFECLICDSSCLECSNGPSECTKCRSGTFLEGTQCVSQCTSNLYIPDSKQNLCNRCSFPCGSCSGTVNTCTSCLPDQQNRILYQSQCLASCPLGTVFDNGTCIACNTNCRSCILTKDTCDSCNTPLKLNKMNNTCVTSCPSGLTIDTGTTCEYCDPTCRTCSIFDPKKCQSCYNGFSLYEANSTCLTQCPIGTINLLNTSTGLSTCTKCNTGCVTCQTSPSYCTKCDASLNYVFYNFGCLKDKCPDGYVPISKERNVCIRDGERCPYGYDFNDFGVCELVVQICEEGYILNHDKTKCIPVPGVYIPVIFILACIGWTIFIIVKYRKVLAPIQIMSQLLVFYTMAQTVTYFTMVALAISLDYMMVKAVHILSFSSMFIANIAFTLLYHIKLRKEDLAFKHWYTEYKNTYTGIKYFMFLFNFKASRVFYSELFPSRHQFNAAFDNKYLTLVRPLFITSLVNFIVQVMPVIVMDIYSLMYIPWGYQIMVMSIDNMVLGLVIFILEIIEFAYYKKLAKETGDLVHDKSLLMMKRSFQDHNVMSIMDDHSMIAFNKQFGPEYKEGVSMLSVDSEMQLYEKKQKRTKLLNKEEETEKELLSRILRRMAQEKKFNEIFNDDEDSRQQDQSIISEDQDIEKMKPSKKDQTIDDCNTTSIRPTKMSLDDPRERIEHKISFRQNLPGKHTYSAVNNRVQNFLDKPIFREDLKYKNHNQSINLINIDSARTEKFYNANNLNRSNSTENVNGFKNLDQPKQNKEDFEKLRTEMQARVERLEKARKMYERDCESCDDEIMREWWDHFGPESDFDADDLSHESFPPVDRRQKNPDYLAKLELFRERLKSKYQFANCYTHITDPHKKQGLLAQKQKNVTRRTQTYEKDIGIGYDPFAQDYNLMHLDEEHKGEIDEDYTIELIKRVIDFITEQDSNIENKKDTIEDDSDSDFDFDKLKKSKKRKRDVQFDLDDIMGMFDIDDFGNIILNTETMRDNLNRRVNKHGYLVDNKRNIINQEGDVIFEADELDEDEEIPMAYRFEKRKKQLLRGDENGDKGMVTERQYDIDSILNDEDAKIEEEFQKLKDLSRPSSVDSRMGQEPGVDGDGKEGQPENLIIDFSEEKRKKDEYNQRDKDLAKAYGGKPKKKKKKPKKKKDLDSDRLPTDRVFSYLHQEEERVKRMAMISYQIDNTNRNIQSNLEQTQQIQDPTQADHIQTETKDFDSYFREQLQEIQQYRQAAREELNFNMFSNDAVDEIYQNAEQQVQQQQYQDNDDREEEKLQRLDSATTDKQDYQDVIDTEEVNQYDPMQELIQQDAERANKFLQRVQRNQRQQQTYNVPQQQQQLQQRQQFLRQFPGQSSGLNSGLNFYPGAPMSAMSMSSIQGNTVEQQASFLNQVPSIQANAPLQRKFDFYLPTSTKQAKIKKNLQKDKEKKDIVFSNIGRMQLQGAQQAANDTGRLKDMEKVYLQKYPKNQSLVQEARQNVHSAMPRKRMAPFRSNTITDQSQGYRPSQTTYGGGMMIQPHVQNFQGTNESAMSGLGMISNTISGLNNDLGDFRELNVQSALDLQNNNNNMLWQ